MARCGDGIQRSDLTSDDEGYEACDDGNEVLGDGCTPECRRERCGNGVLDEGEQCDDGNQIDDDACIRKPPPACGDGILQGDLTVDDEEACDDGNEVIGDGCTPECRRERCGNGVLDEGEQCDDGNPIETDANLIGLPACPLRRRGAACRCRGLR